VPYPEVATGGACVALEVVSSATGGVTEVSAVDGLPVVHAMYYRHWPRRHFVTTKARTYMRR